MYNLKIEALKIINQLIDSGYEASFIGNYPFVKYHNSIHVNEKLKIKQLEIITNAPLNVLQEMFKVTKINSTDYNKSVLIEMLIKQNLVYFKVFHATEYTNVITGKTKMVNTIPEILDNFSFLLETITINKSGQVLNYVNKKMDAYQSIKEKVIYPNGNFREKVLENPLIMLELCYYASNLNYSLIDSNLKIIANNNHYLKYESINNIVKYFNMILMASNPLRGIKIIKEYMLDFNYNDIKLFGFLKDIPDEYISVLSKFNGIDIISRWAYLLKPLSIKQAEIILDDFQLSFKNKVIWLLQNFKVIEQENYKMAIYNTKESLKLITESKYDIFLLFEMFEKLTKLYKTLDMDKDNKCQNIIDTICSRPLFNYQLMYDDKEICRMVNMEPGEWLEIAKNDLVIKILMCNKHPNEEQYLSLLKESINYGIEQKKE